MGAPLPTTPPCILQRRFPRTAGDRHGLPLRVRAPQRSARCMGNCSGCISFFRFLAINFRRLHDTDDSLTAGIDVDVLHCGPAVPNASKTTPSRNRCRFFLSPRKLRAKVQPGVRLCLGELSLVTAALANLFTVRRDRAIHLFARVRHCPECSRAPDRPHGRGSSDPVTLPEFLITASGSLRLHAQSARSGIPWSFLICRVVTTASRCSCSSVLLATNLLAFRRLIPMASKASPITSPTPPTIRLAHPTARPAAAKPATAA